MWFDSHCHLHLCGENEPVAEVIERARRAGVLEMLTVGIDIESSVAAVKTAAERGVYASVGVHPNSASGWSEALREDLARLIDQAGVVAVGETGLDFYRDRTAPEEQREAFLDHIELAKQHDKALVIHTRDSVSDALDILAEVGPPDDFVFHCWSGAEEQLDIALGLGAYISFAGNVSYPSAENIRASARLVPHDRLLVETDSPFLTPLPHRGKPNEPRQISFVGLAVARAREVSAHLLAEQTTQNARLLFG